MSKSVAVLLCATLVATPLTSIAQSGPAQLEAPSGKQMSINTYADSDGRQRSGKLPVAALIFPIRVYEETPTGMLRIQHAGENVWVAREDFRVHRNVKADCNVVMERISTGADRGANEGCSGIRKR